MDPSQAPPDAARTVVSIMRPDFRRARRRFWRSQPNPRASAKERTVLRFKLNQEGQLVCGGTSDLHRSPVIDPDG